MLKIIERTSEKNVFEVVPINRKTDDSYRFLRSEIGGNSQWCRRLKYFFEKNLHSVICIQHFRTVRNYRQKYPKCSLESLETRYEG